MTVTFSKLCHMCAIAFVSFAGVSCFMSLLLDERIQGDLIFGIALMAFFIPLSVWWDHYLENRRARKLVKHYW